MLGNDQLSSQLFFMCLLLISVMYGRIVRKLSVYMIGICLLPGERSLLLSRYFAFVYWWRIIIEMIVYLQAISISLFFSNAIIITIHIDITALLAGIITSLFNKPFTKIIYKLFEPRISNPLSCQLIMMNISKGNNRLTRSKQLKEILNSLIML